MTPVAKREPSYRPYAPPSNLTGVLQRIRSRNLPECIDDDYLRAAGVPDGSIPRTIAALEFLGLIDEEAPTLALRSIARSTNEEYQGILADLIRTAYQDVFALVDPAQDPQDRIANVFRRYTPASQQGRMVIFFLALCREAGIETLDTPRQRGSNVSKNSPVRAPGKAGLTSRAVTGRSNRALIQDQPIQGKEISNDLAPALQGLMRSLPSSGTPLSQQRKDQWIMMARATIDFIYPDPEEVVLQEAEEE